MKKWDKTRWAAEILFHLVMLFGSFTAGCFLAPRGKQDIAVGIYIAAVMVRLGPRTGLYRDRLGRRGSDSTGAVADVWRRRTDEGGRRWSHGRLIWLL